MVQLSLPTTKGDLANLAGVYRLAREQTAHSKMEIKNKVTKNPLKTIPEIPIGLLATTAYYYNIL